MYINRNFLVLVANLLRASSGFIIISLCIFIIAKPFNLFSHVVFRKYVYNLFNVEKYPSLLAVVTGNVAKICKNLKVEGKIDMLHF
jgi:hypothetical protein